MSQNGRFRLAFKAWKTVKMVPMLQKNILNMILLLGYDWSEPYWNKTQWLKQKQILHNENSVKAKKSITEGQ